MALPVLGSHVIFMHLHSLFKHRIKAFLFATKSQACPLMIEEKS